MRQTGRHVVALVVAAWWWPLEVGAEPHPQLAGLDDNTVLDLGEYPCTAPEGEPEGLCKTITDYSGFVYDATRRQMVMFGAGHAASFTDTISVFDLETLAWSDLYTPTPCSSMTLGNLDTYLGAWLSGPAGPYPRPFATHTYDLMAIVGDELIMASSGSGTGSCAPTDGPFATSGRVAHYSFNTGTWSFTDAERFFLPALEHDPVSNKLVLLGRDAGLEIYDPATGEYTNPLPDVGDNDMGIDGQLLYVPPQDRFYYLASAGGSTHVWQLELDRDAFTGSLVTRLDPSGTPSPNDRGYAYDSVNNRIGGGTDGSTFYIFDPEAVAWSSTIPEGGSPDPVADFAIEYDPINNVYIYISQGAGLSQRTWAYRYRRGGPPDTLAPAAPRNVVVI